jgi:hypothetical protein
MMEKYEVDGKVAVLVSFGYGAGWTTWAGDDAERKMFDPVLVKMLLDSKEEITDAIVKYVDETYPDSYNGGLDGLSVVLVEKGAKFVIDEYDGSESLTTIDEYDWIVA